MGIDFGDLDADEKVDTTPKSGKPSTPRTNYKRKYKQLEVAFDNLQESNKQAYEHVTEKLQTKITELNELERWAENVKKNETQMHELQDEIHRLTVQGNMDKKALDKTTMMLAKLQFNPLKFSQLVQVLSYMRIHGTKSALQRVTEIVGTTEIVEVRKWIFDLLEAPYK